MPYLSRLSRTNKINLKDWEKKKPESGKRPVAMKLKTARPKQGDSEKEKEQRSKSPLADLELFSDNLRKLKEDYRQYYQEEQTFENLYRHLDIDSDDAIRVLSHLFESYNTTMGALIEFDNLFRTTYAEQITALIKTFEDPLSEIGIQILVDGTLLVNLETFKTVHDEKITCFDFLIDAHAGLFTKLYERLHDIKIERLPSEDTLLNEGLHGVIIDMKC